MSEKLPDLFKNNNTMKDPQIHMQFKPGQYPLKQKARPIAIHLQEELGKRLDKLVTAGHLEHVKHVEKDIFVSPTVIPVKTANQ